MPDEAGCPEKISSLFVDQILLERISQTLLSACGSHPSETDWAQHFAIRIMYELLGSGARSALDLVIKVFC